MLYVTVIGSLLASLLGAPAAADPPLPPPSGRIVIDVVTVNGSGCPAGTAAVAVAADNTAFTVTYSYYQAPMPNGGPATPTDMRKICQLSFVVHAPTGYTYAIDQSKYQGFASLRPGASGTHRGSIAFQGTRAPLVTHTFVGPLIDDWQATDATDPSELIFAPCTGRPLNLNLTNALDVITGPTRPDDSLISLDSSTHRFVWRSCMSA